MAIIELGIEEGEEEDGEIWEYGKLKKALKIGGDIHGRDI